MSKISAGSINLRPRIKPYRPVTPFSKRILAEKHRLERTMVVKCSILGKELQAFQSLNGIRALAETGRFKIAALVKEERRRNEEDALREEEEAGTYRHVYLQAWFLDQFGVLHDGKQPYPGAISTLEKLANCGAKMVIISNSSRRASTTIEKMNSLGFESSLFLGAITSGELTHQYLHRRDDLWFAALGRSCIHMTWGDRGAISLEGLDLQVVESIEDADFVLVHGTEALGLPSGDALPMKLEELEKILEGCAKKKIPMVVANPDFVTVEARALRVMPGTLAAKYEKLGGEVKWMGKPDKVIYQAAMAMVGVDASDCIAVGDSLHHDIKGANVGGIESAFISGGIHATELGLHTFGEVAESSAIETLISKYDAQPSYVLPAFQW